MKEFTSTETSVKLESMAIQSTIRVCMHVRGVVRLDPRVMREASALTEAGFTVTIVDIESECNRPAEEDVDGINVKHIRKPDWLNPPHSKLWKVIKSVQKLIGSTLSLIRTPADIYHAHDVNALLPCYFAAQISRKILVFDAHEMPLYEFEGTSRKWVRVLITQLFIGMVQRCAGVITVSPPIVKEMFNRYHISEVSLVRNIPPYRIVPRNNYLQQYLSLSSNIRIVLYQGNLQPDRNLDKLVHAAAYLEQNVVIVLMGKGVRNTAAELEALAAQKGVTDRLRIIPPVPYEELLHWSASADIGVIVSAPEYSLNVRMFLPNKLFEYLMAGVPVLSSPLPAIVEVINTYDVGCILSSLEPKNIAAEINAMLKDRIGLERMKRNALEVAESVFCWERESLQLINLYENILAARNKQCSGKKTLSFPGIRLSRK